MRGINIAVIALAGALLLALPGLTPAADASTIPEEGAAQPRAVLLGPRLDYAPAPTPAAPTTGITITGATLPATVSQFQRFEMVVSLSGTIAMPYETDPQDGGLDLVAILSDPTGKIWEVPGFYDGSTTPAAWKVRFNPCLASATVPWQVTLSARGSDHIASWTGSFLCSGTLTNAAARGFVQISGGGLQFSGSHGWFSGLGHNTGWQPLVETPSLASMAAGGENTLGFWMAEPWTIPFADGSGAQVLPARAPLENADEGLANYNQAACAYLDSVVADAEAAGIYLMPALWAHDELQDAASPWGAGSWDNNAYQAVCTGSAEFFDLGTSAAPSASWHYQANRYRYIAARWGSSTAILGWVGLSEIDGTIGTADSLGLAWATAVRGAMSQWDPYRRATTSGGAMVYPLTVTKTDTTADAPTWDTALDLQACDSYLSEFSNEAVPLTIGNEIQSLASASQPSFIDEFGADLSNTSASDPSQPEHLRRGVMAGLGCGASIAPLLWTDGENFPLVVPGKDLALQYAAISTFLGGLSDLGNPALVAPNLYPSAATTSVYGLCRAGTPDWGFAWLAGVAPLSGSGTSTLAIGGLQPGSYQVLWYDLSAGAVVQVAQATTATITIEGAASTGLSLVIPTTLGSDLAVRYTSDLSAMLPILGVGGPPAGSTTSSTSGTSSTTAAGTTGSASTSATTTSAGGSTSGAGLGSGSSAGSNTGCGVGGLMGMIALLGLMRVGRRRRHS